jgi:hypothetical protein
VHAGGVAPQGNIGGKLVEFAADGELFARKGEERQTVLAGNYRLSNDKRFVKITSVRDKEMRSA